MKIKKNDKGGGRCGVRDSEFELRKFQRPAGEPMERNWCEWEDFNE